MNYMLKIGTFVFFFIGLLGSNVSALTIDTNAGWDGHVNTGWYGSGQSLTVDAIENHFDSIGFYFDEQSYGQTFDFLLSDAMNGGATLLSTSFVVTSGINIINIDQDMVANSSVYALIDYNGYSGDSAHFSYVDTYAGGQSLFGPIGGMTDYYTSMDHRFIAEFSGGGAAPVPEPATMLLFGTGLAGLIGSRIRRKKK